MSKPLIPRHWRPAAVLVAVAFVVVVMDRTGVVNVPEPLIWTLVAIQWSSIGVTLWWPKLSARFRKQAPRPKWAKDDD